MKIKQIITGMLCTTLIIVSIFSVSVQAETENYDQILTNPSSDTPSDTRPSDNPPSDTPSDTRPSDTPPSETPSDTRPSDNPPSETPSDTRPSDNPSSDTPSDIRPSDNPPSDTPSDTKPTDTPSDTNPSDEPSDNSQGATIGSMNVAVKIDGSQATIEDLSSDDINKAATTSGDKLTIDVSDLESNGVPVLVDRINMPMQVGEDILAVLLSNANKKNSVEFLVPGKGISMDSKAFNTVVDQASEASTISVEAKDIEKRNLSRAQQEAINQLTQGKDTNIASLIDVNVLAGGTSIHNLKGGTATIAVNLGSSTEWQKQFKAFYLSEDGKVEQQPTNNGEWVRIIDPSGGRDGYENKNTGEFITKADYCFSKCFTGHFSTYAFIYEEVQSNDANVNTSNVDIQKSPKTGDDSNPYALMILLISSLGVLMVVAKILKSNVSEKK